MTFRAKRSLGPVTGVAIGKTIARMVGVCHKDEKKNLKYKKAHLPIPIDISQSLLLSEAHRMEFSFLHIVSVNNNVGSVRLALLDLHNGRDIGHHDRCGHV